MDGINPNLPFFEIDIRTKLYEHQKSTLQALDYLEENERKWKDVLIKPSMGILCDKPASGKTLTMLTHVWSKPYISNNKRPSYTDSHLPRIDNLQIMTETTWQTLNSLKTSLIVVPRLIIEQWESTARDLVGFYQEFIPDQMPRRMEAFLKRQPASPDAKKLGIFQRELSLDNEEAIFSNRYDLIIMNERSYKSLIRSLNTKNFLFQRLIIDEVDYIHIPAFEPVPAIFIWCIQGQFYVNDNIGTRLAISRSRTIYFKNLFHRSFEYLNEMLQKTITVSNNGEFIDASLNLPPPRFETITLKRSILNQLVRDILPTEMMARSLNAFDYDAIIGCLRNASSSESIISSLMKDFDNRIENVQQTLRLAPEDTLADLIERINKIKKDRDEVLRRVRESNCCPITLDEIRVKAAVPCCGNVFEFNNVLAWILQKGQCPMCRTYLIPEELIVDNQNKQINTLYEPLIVNSKIQCLGRVITELYSVEPNARVLLFSEHQISNDAYQLLQRTVPDGSVKTTTGQTAHVVKHLKDFREGKIRLLFMDAHTYATGLNLETCTHIITLHRMHDTGVYWQLIGRGQRPGRKTQLQVINIFYDDE